MLCQMAIILFNILFLTTACEHKSHNPTVNLPKEDLQAKKLLQGVWQNDEEGTIAFMAKGDTIFYADSTSLPVYFQFFDDTLVLHSSANLKYAVIKQSEHVFQFKNQMGDIVRLIKSDDSQDSQLFVIKKAIVLNQNELIKRDTVLNYNNQRYHCYVQINPTTYKVKKTVLNEVGVAVDNVYYDNIIHLSVFKGSQKLFSSDFCKKDFNDFIKGNMVKKLILSDMEFLRIDESGIHYLALMAQPDSPSSMVVEVLITYNGKVVKKSATT